MKAFGRALVIVIEKLMNPSDPKLHVILKGLKISVRIDDIIHEYKTSFRYPEDIAEEFEGCCFDYCRTMAALINAYQKADPPVPVFNYTIKAHCLMHLGLRA